MKSNELRIGNWVYPFDDIDLVDEKTILRDSAQVQAEDFVNTYHLEPIPLTEEWLLKFGFELIVNKDVFDDFHYPYFVKNGVILLYNYTSENNICYKGGFAEMRSGKYYAVTPIWINSVHQLQNLYFALTGEELK